MSKWEKRAEGSTQWRSNRGVSKKIKKLLS
jgi:hypothetical protein